MEDPTQQWFDKIADVLHTEVKVKGRICSLKSLKKGIRNDPNLSQNDLFLLIDHIDRSIEKANEENIKKDLRGFDFIGAVIEDLEDAASEYIHNTKFVKTKADVRWKQMTPIIRRINPFKFEDTVKILMLQANKKDLYEYLYREITESNETLLQELDDELNNIPYIELKKIDSTSDAPVWQKSILNYARILSEIFEVVKGSRPPEVSDFRRVGVEEVQKWIIDEEKFYELEEQLFKRKCIVLERECLRWNYDRKNNTYKKLYDLSLVLIKKYKVFRPVIGGKTKKDWHYRQFISLRYGLKKDQLSKTHKDYTPSLQMAEASFHWL